jgi:hypothetical protein
MDQLQWAATSARLTVAGSKAASAKKECFDEILSCTQIKNINMRR